MKLLGRSLGIGAAVTTVLYALGIAIGGTAGCVLMWQTCLLYHHLYPRPVIHINPTLIPIGVLLSVLTYSLAAYIVLLFTTKPAAVEDGEARGGGCCGCLTALASAFAVSLLCLLLL